MKPKNYVKLGFLKGLVTIEAPTSTSPAPEDLFKLYRSTVLTVCILAVTALAILLILKISLLHLAWLVPALKTGASWISAIWGYFKR